MYLFLTTSKQIVRLLLEAVRVESSTIWWPRYFQHVFYNWTFQPFMWKQKQWFNQLNKQVGAKYDEKSAEIHKQASLRIHKTPCAFIYPRQYTQIHLEKASPHILRQVFLISKVWAVHKHQRKEEAHVRASDLYVVICLHFKGQKQKNSSWFWCSPLPPQMTTPQTLPWLPPPLQWMKESGWGWGGRWL